MVVNIYRKLLREYLKQQTLSRCKKLLKEAGEVTISEYGCHWWGRQTSGQAIRMDYVIQKIAHSLQ